MVCSPTIPSPPAQSRGGRRDGGAEGGEKLTLYFVFAHVDECWRVDQVRFEVVDHDFFLRSPELELELELVLEEVVVVVLVVDGMEIVGLDQGRKGRTCRVGSG